MVNGLYPHAHGIVANCGARQHGLAPDDVTTERILSEAGHQTNHYGQWHLHGRDLPYYPDMFRPIDYQNQMKATFDRVRAERPDGFMPFYAWALPVEVDPARGADAVITFGPLSAPRVFAAAHWSEDRLACAFDPGCTDPVELGAFPVEGDVRAVAQSGEVTLVGDGREGLRTLLFGPEYVLPTRVQIDIRPLTPFNWIHPEGRELVPVAILGSDAFPVSEVDRSSLAFGPNGAAPKLTLEKRDRDISGDEVADLLSFYRSNETGIAIGDTQACVTGVTRDGIAFEGCDSVLVGACGLGFELAFLLPPLMWLYDRRRRRSA